MKENIFDVIKNDERFTILTKMLETSGIGESMAAEKEAFTFFAPTDDAFKLLSEKALKILISPAGSEIASAILGQLLIPHNYLYSSDLRKKSSVESMIGTKLKITEKSNVLQLEEANILMPGIAATNAVIFPIDKLLSPRKKAILQRPL